MSRPICKAIEIALTLDAVGLVGGEYESEPSVHSWCSFNPHRIIKSHILDTTNPTKCDITLNSPLVYTSRERDHYLNGGHAYNFLMGHDFGDNGDDDENENETDKSHSEANTTIAVPQNTTIYRTRTPIVYDLSNADFHGHKTMRTDATVWLKLMVVSLISGVPKIDENDRVFTRVKRDIQAGVCQLQLCDLYKEAAMAIRHTQSGGPADVAFTIETSFVDPKLMNIEMMEIAQRYVQEHDIEMEEIPHEVEQHITETAFLRTRRAIVSAVITLRSFDFAAYKDSRFSLADLKTSPLNALMKANRYGNNVDGTQRIAMQGRDAFEPTLYNSLPGIAEIRANMAFVQRVYCDAFVPLGDRPCRYQAANDNVRKLHMPHFIGEQGTIPVVGFFGSHTPHTREYASEEARRTELELYDYDDTTEEHLTLMIAASLRRHGMSRDLFMATIKQYFAADNKAANASGLFITAVKIIADAATFAANSIYYTADFRYQKLDRNATIVNALKRSTEALFKKHNVDSFDSTSLNGTGNAGDCEDSANVAYTILQCFGHGRYRLGNEWRSPLLNSVKAVLDRMVIFAVGATVTSAYVDNNNKPVDMKEENRDLPIVGDSLDNRSQCDGHCYAIMLMDAVVDQLLANGNLDERQLATVRRQWPQQFTKRDFTVPVIVLEGTGSVEPTLLPVDEVYDDDANRRVERIQARCEIAFLKEMKARLTSDRDAYKDIIDMFSGEGVPFYVEKQPINRRVSRFYRELIHGIALNLYSKRETLSQISFCKRVHTGRGGEHEVGYEYGVNTGELLRSGTAHNKEIALITPFKDISREWHHKVIRMMESVENQMPIMRFGHYTREQFTTGVYSRFVPHTNRLGDTTGRLIEAMLEKVAGNPELTVVRLQSREWKLRDKERLAKLDRFISSFDKVVCHGIFAEKHIDRCDALVDILLVVKCQQ